MARPPRQRRQRREQERALRKTVRSIDRAADQLPGGAPDRPIEVGASSIVEVKARSTPCLQCGGHLEIRRDNATSTDRGVLRQIETICRLCHAPRTVWFRVAVTQAN